MVTLTFSNANNSVKVHYKTDITELYKRQIRDYRITGETLDPAKLTLFDNFNVLDIQDESWKFLRTESPYTRNKISPASRALNMIVYVGADNDGNVLDKYYQLIHDPLTMWTEDDDWVEYTEGQDFVDSLPLRPQFMHIEYTIEGFRAFAEEYEYNLDLYLSEEIINLYTV